MGMISKFALLTDGSLFSF